MAQNVCRTSSEIRRMALLRRILAAKTSDGGGPTFARRLRWASRRPPRAARAARNIPPAADRRWRPLVLDRKRDFSSRRAGNRRSAAGLRWWAAGSREVGRWRFSWICGEKALVSGCQSGYIHVHRGDTMRHVTRNITPGFCSRSFSPISHAGRLALFNSWDTPGRSWVSRR